MGEGVKSIKGDTGDFDSEHNQHDNSDVLRMPILEELIHNKYLVKNMTILTLKGVKESGREIKGSEADFQFQPKRFPGIVKLIHPTI